MDVSPPDDRTEAVLKSRRGKRLLELASLLPLDLRGLWDSSALVSGGKKVLISSDVVW